MTDQLRRGAEPRPLMLSMGSDAECSRQAVRPEQPGGADLTDIEPIAVERRRLPQAGLLAARPVVVVGAERENRLLGVMVAVMP